MRKIWDHTIDMKEEFIPRKRKMYLLSRKEREEVHEFIKEQLRKGYIRPSKLLQMAPVFFVGKKDRKKRMVQDYWYLNEWTVKNNYPLPLISDVIKNIGTKRVFTKMDLRWGYNNIRIKEGDEWKAVFTALEGSFEPTVIFFRLTNSPVTFQTMMNKLLRDLINMGKVVVFIDDVIVGMENEERHNELVAEIIKRLEENNLYVKPEKYKWKVREVGFLGVVIRPEGIKMVKEKVKGDTSDYTYTPGGVLSMEYEDSRWRPVAFLSKSLSETERNYEIHDKEMLAIIRGLENWKHLLEGVHFKFEIWTDHKNLEYFMKVQKLNCRQARWVLYLSRFDFTLKYILETKMGKADGLSRRLDWKVEIEKNNDNQVFIKDNWIHSLQEVVIEGPEVDILEKIKKARSKDKKVVRVVEEMKKTGIKVIINGR